MSTPKLRKSYYVGKDTTDPDVLAKQQHAGESSPVTLLRETRFGAIPRRAFYQLLVVVVVLLTFAIPYGYWIPAAVIFWKIGYSAVDRIDIRAVLIGVSIGAASVLWAYFGRGNPHVFPFAMFGVFFLLMYFGNAIFEHYAWYRINLYGLKEDERKTFRKRWAKTKPRSRWGKAFVFCLGMAFVIWAAELGLAYVLTDATPRVIPRMLAVFTSIVGGYLVWVWSTSNIQAWPTNFELRPESDLFVPAYDFWLRYERDTYCQEELRGHFFRERHVNMTERQLDSVFSLFMFSLVLLPGVLFFPITLGWNSQWQDAYYERYAEVPRPTTDSLVSTLTAKQHEVFERLTPDERRQAGELFKEDSLPVLIAEERQRTDAELLSRLNTEPISAVAISVAAFSKNSPLFFLSLGLCLVLSWFFPAYALRLIAMMGVPRERYEFLGQVVFLQSEMAAIPDEEPVPPKSENRTTRKRKKSEPGSRPEATRQNFADRVDPIPPGIDNPLAVRQDLVKASPFSKKVHDILRSDKDIKKNCLFWGLHNDAHDMFEVLIDRKFLREHTHISGNSGSGKTSIGVLSMLKQLIFQAARDQRGRNPDLMSFVIIDLKGDKELFFSTLEMAKAANIRMKWYNTSTFSPSYVFNPMTDGLFEYLTDDQRVGSIMQSLGVAHGEGYGRGYFSGQTRAYLEAYLKKYRDEVTSFYDLAWHFRNNRFPLAKSPSDEKRRDEAVTELRNAVDILSRVPLLNLCNKTRELYSKDSDEALRVAFKNRMQTSDLFIHPEIHYYYIPSKLSGDISREVAKTVIFDLMAHAELDMDISNAPTHRLEKLHKKRGHTAHWNSKQVYLFIDEFQRVVSKDLEVFLQQARSANIAVTLSHQDLADLNTPAGDLRPVVQTNSNIKWWFAVGNPDTQDNIIKLSGETMEYVEDESYGTSESFDGGMRYSKSTTRKEVRVPRLNRDELNALASDPEMSVLQKRDNTHPPHNNIPFRVRCWHPYPLEEAKRRAKLKWPHPGNEEKSLLPKGFESSADDWFQGQLFTKQFDELPDDGHINTSDTLYDQPSEQANQKQGSAKNKTRKKKKPDATDNTPPEANNDGLDFDGAEQDMKDNLGDE